VIGIANPKLSRFDSHEDLKNQVTFNEVLLTRFDLKFAFKDIPDEERDSKICNRVFESEEVKTQMTSDFLFKYIIYAKKYMPKLSDATFQLLKKYYLYLRVNNIQNSGILQITQRQFDALIRIAEAYAKLRLAEETNEKDGENAIKLFENYLQSFGFNPVICEIDIDKAEGRPSTETRNKYYRILEIMRDLQKIFPKGIPRVDFEQACSKEFTLTDVEQWIKKARNEGIILEPKPRFFEVV